MVFFLSFFIDNPLQAQRVRYGFEYPCYEQPAPQPPSVEIPPPTLCISLGNLGTFVEIGQGTPFPNATSLGFFLSNQTYKVVGDFHINDNWITNNCIFSIAPNVSIFIDDDAGFLSVGCKYFCCDGMWEGIKVGTNSAIRFTSQSHIEDARIGIYFTDRAKNVRISNSIFNRNEVHLNAVGNILAKGPSYVPLTEFVGNNFTCDSKLNTGSTYEYTRIAFSTAFVQIPTLGTAGSPNIFFGKITLGISALGADLKVSNCIFRDISTGVTPPATPATIGLGIWARGGNLDVVGLGTFNNDLSVGSNAIATFRNCEEGGIKAEATNLKVKDAYFEFSSGIIPLSTVSTLKKFKSAISSTSNTGGQLIEIKNNLFNLYVRGVGVYLSRSASLVNNITNNHFKINPAKSKSILIDTGFDPALTCILVNKGSSTPQSEKSKCNVSENEIRNFDLSVYLTGIQLDEGFSYTVHNNDINRLPSFGSTGTINCWGIKVRQVGGSSFRYNKVYGYSNVNAVTQQPSSAGLEFSRTGLAANGNLVCNNRVENNEKGFSFLNDCRGVIFAENEFFPNDYGLAIGTEAEAGTIGAQWNLKTNDNIQYRKNYWIYPKPGTFGTHGNRFFKDDPKQSQFIVANPVSGINPSTGFLTKTFPSNGTITVPSPYVNKEWFNTDITSGLDQGCGSFTDNLTGGGDDNEVWKTYFDEIIAGTFTGTYDVDQWEEERLVYNVLLENPSLLTGNGVRQQFFKNRSQGNMPLYVEIAEGKRNLFSTNAVVLEQLLELRTTENNLWQNLVIRSEEALLFATEDGLRPEDRLDIDVLNTQFAAVKQFIDDKEVVQNESVSAKIVHLLNRNASIVPQTPYEEANKKANRIWLTAVLQDGTLSESDLSEARVIAGECYQNVGRIRYELIDILPYCERDDYPYYTCAGLIFKTDAAKDNVLIHPNPANTQISITLANVNDTKAMVLTDLSGRVIQNIAILPNTDSYNLDVTNIQQGLYLLQVQNNAGITAIQKINIIH